MIISIALYEIVLINFKAVTVVFFKNTLIQT